MKPIYSLFAVLLAACTPASAPVSPPLVIGGPVILPDNGLLEREPDSCGSEKLQNLIGQNEGMLRTVRTKGALRIIAPGAIISQEYDPNRLNTHVDAAGMIQKLSCG